MLTLVLVAVDVGGGLRGVVLGDRWGGCWVAGGGGGGTSSSSMSISSLPIVSSNSLSMLSIIIFRGLLTVLIRVSG